jgi:cysteine dioxygenase
LSTLIESATDSTPGGCSTEAALTLKGLIALLEEQDSAPSLDQLYGWLKSSRISADELKPYVAFKEGTYWRHLVCRTTSLEMLLLCWRPGQRTVIHDHNGSQGAVLVQQGVLWETMFSFDEENGLRYNSIAEHQQGAVTGADVPDIHQLGNPDASEQDLITIHIYSPPLGVLHTYKPGSATVDLYTPADPDS